MKKRIKTKWLKALRSGAYFQGTGQLITVSEDDDGEDQHNFCCLGVLENLMCEEKGIGFFEDRGRSPLGVKENAIWDDGYHSNACARWAGLPVQLKGVEKSSTFYGGAGDTPTKLTMVDNPLVEEIASMNDRGRSFKHIANWIERHL